MAVSLKYSGKGHLYLILILLAASAITIASSVLNYRNSLDAAEDALRFQALGITASLEASLKNSGELQGKRSAGRNIFRDIITGGEWEGIAFIALYDEEGAVILHSNENLIGRRAQDDSFRQAIAAGKPVYNYRVLGTGERVFISNSPLSMRNAKGVLRIAFHTYPAEKIIRQSRLQIASISLLILILWVTGYFLARALKRAEELRKAVEEKERLAVLGGMSSVLAHEIRNPLGSIKGFAQYLLEQERSGQERQAGTGRECLGVIVSESKRLEALTEDLLLYARPAEVRLQEFPVYELVAEIVQAFMQNPDTARSAIGTSIPADMKIVSDRDKLRQIMTNVIQNAIDATGDGGTVAVSAESAAGELILTVRDSGCGMDGETLRKAFSPFFTTKTRGTGLGLAIVDKLVRALHGKIEVSGEAGKGTTVRITIPVMGHA